MIVGIHTPELSTEHGLSNVQADANKKGLRFPILVDDEEKNWNLWGNSMWPSLYLIDKHGYARFWWYGELDWQGSNNHLLAKKRIRELMAEN